MQSNPQRTDPYKPPSLIPQTEKEDDQLIKIIAPLFYSMTTLAPTAFRVSMIFSASSLGTDSFIILGTDSTNFLLSTRERPSRLLISLMTLALEAASTVSSFRLKRVFSCAAGAASSSSAAAGAAAAPPPGPAATAKPPTGRSGIFRRD